MFEDIPLIYGNVKILNGLSLIYKDSWKRNIWLALPTPLVLSQFYYYAQSNDSIDAIIRNSYAMALWFNSLFRAYVLVYNRKDFELLIDDMVKYYYELLATKDPYVQKLLNRVNNIGKAMTRGNLILGSMTCIGFNSFTIFLQERVLPFGGMIPGINELESPYYEVLYVYHTIITPVGFCMYIPFTSLMVSLIMFGIIMCKSLQNRLRAMKQSMGSDSAIKAEVVECVKYQEKIIRYIKTVNSLTMFAFSVEFLAFGAVLCGLLFLLIIVNTTAQAIIVCAYITMILAQILALYWYANELMEQNLAIANAAYESEWFTFQTNVQKNIILIIIRAQKPCPLMIGNTYPITLELFQALMNASYSYFTLLKRVYG